ncbi:MAG: hypothetical protein COA43_07700 [Robiginitomaculum sp.]|nr:MAG: hypothetical protein COA43_07700 [Robiginitomaculum sp.]
MTTTYSLPKPIYNPQNIAFILRIGLGVLFVIGGWNKLYQLLDPALADNILASYTGPRGYINAFFADFLFVKGPFTPWGFLTALSAFELMSGILLIVGFLVRPIALIFAFLLWSFVISLPVSTETGGNYLAPAALVQARDIGLSGMMFVVFVLGAGKHACDNKIFNATSTQPSWDNLGLVLRLSVALPLLVGGAFAGMVDIKTFGVPGWGLFLTGALLVTGIGVRWAATAFIAILVFYIATKFSFEKSMISNLNSVKREFAFLAACAVLIITGGGTLFTPKDILGRIRFATARKIVAQ